MEEQKIQASFFEEDLWQSEGGREPYYLDIQEKETGKDHVSRKKEGLEREEKTVENLSILKTEVNNNHKA